MNQTSKTDVLIVGGGPTGLTLAIELKRRGIDSRIVDQAETASQKTKALGVMARTLELFEQMGINKTFVDKGHRTTGFHAYSDGKELFKIHFPELIDSAYNYVLMIPQNETEEILNNYLQELGGKVERQITLKAFSQKQEGVEAILQHQDGREEQIQAKWLVGCDGAHSTVRHILGLEFEGTTFEHTFALADIRLENSELSHDDIYAFLHQGEFAAFFPMINGKHRVIITGSKGSDIQNELTLAEVQGTIDRCGPKGTKATEPSWLARFRVNQRKVKSYRQGNVFLAGDAAHIHSPIGAQGMNTGIQDAFNLGWKLSQVVQGISADTLLDSYEAEREPVGATLVRGTEMATRMVLQKNKIPVTLRNFFAPIVMSWNATQRQLAKTISQTGISYQGSSIIDEEGSKHRIHAGDRAPNGLVIDHDGTSKPLMEILQGTNHSLILFSDSEHTLTQISKISDYINPLPVDLYIIQQAKKLNRNTENNHQIFTNPEGTLKIKYDIQEGIILIRPDGYIGYREDSLDFEPLRAYLDKFFKQV